MQNFIALKNKISFKMNILVNQPIRGYDFKMP